MGNMRLRLTVIWFLNIADMLITMYGLKMFPQYLYEANGVMANVVASNLSHFLVKVVFVGLVCLLVYFAYQLTKKKPIKAFFTLMSYLLLIEYLYVVGIISVRTITCMLM
jgi:hypothetical protein